MKFKVLLCIFAGLFSGVAAQAQDMSDEAIKSRIQAVGKIHVAGAKSASNAVSGPRSGADIYNKACVACHSSGVLGAPKLQVAADWTARLENGFDTVWQNAINGINAMPPMGTCADCSDDDIKVAIEYMIEGI
ncbi:MAG: cytochrome c5 [Paraglaciecola sp.]|jgi:cytochrome c5